MFSFNLLDNAFKIIIINMIYLNFIVKFWTIILVTLNMERKFSKKSQLNIYVYIFSRFTLVIHKLKILLPYFVREILGEQF